MMQKKNEPAILPEGYDQTTSSLLQLASSFGERGMNTIPFKGSWTGAQVIDHIIRSNKSIAQALAMEGNPVNRKYDERKPELAKIFLDFNTRLKSPDFILPTQEAYEKSSLLAALQSSADSIIKAAVQASLSDAIKHVAFGEITKMELLYFVMYHTQRHTRQLHHIYEIVESRQYKLLSFLFMHPVTFF